MLGGDRDEGLYHLRIVLATFLVTFKIPLVVQENCVDHEDVKVLESIDEDPSQTQEQLRNCSILNVTRETKRLHALRMIQKQGNSVLYELKLRNEERRRYECEHLLLHRVVTGAEKWIYYSNPKRKNPGNHPRMHQHQHRSPTFTKC